MQTTQQSSGHETESGFPAIPARIREVPPLIIDAGDPCAIAEQVTSHLGELSQRLAEVHRAAAEAYLAQGMFAEALPHCEAAATFAPTVLEHHNQLGFVLYIEGNDEAAAAAFTKVLNVEPTHPDALFNLGMVQFGRGDHASAEECFRRSLEVRPDDPETWNNRGVCLHYADRIHEARSCFERALQLDPSNEDAAANFGAIG